MPKAGEAHPLDVAAGQRIRERRRHLGWTQAELGRAIGVTFQQVQKYERGTNRLGFSRLAQVAQALRCRVSDLVDGIDACAGDGEVEAVNQLVAQAGALDLLEAYAALPDSLRRAILRHARSLAAAVRPGDEA